MRLEEAIERWQHSGHTVLAHSDHGMVRTRAPRPLLDLWRRINSEENCVLPPGGAGRVLWSYPKRESTREVHARLSEALDDRALVVYREELTDLGLMKMNEKLAKRVGSVVALATGTEFPLPDSDPRPYEHGSILPDEMLAVLAVWTGQ